MSSCVLGFVNLSGSGVLESNFKALANKSSLLLCKMLGTAATVFTRMNTNTRHDCNMARMTFSDPKSAQNFFSKSAICHGPSQIYQRISCRILRTTSTTRMVELHKLQHQQQGVEEHQRVYTGCSKESDPNMGNGASMKERNESSDSVSRLRKSASNSSLGHVIDTHTVFGGGGSSSITELQCIPKNKDDRALISKAAKSMFMFQALNRSLLRKLVDAFSPIDCVVGEVVIAEGDNGHYM
jgi:hypothetical protein